MKIFQMPLHYLGQITGFLVEYMTDMWFHTRYSYHSSGSKRDARLFYRIVIEAHTVEKGLSLHRPRPLFGVAKIKSLLAFIRQYNQAFSSFPIAMANGALREYVALHSNMDSIAPILIAIKEYLDSSLPDTNQATGGIKSVDSLAGVRNESAIEFLKSRSSCRMFAPHKIDQSIIAEIITLAQVAPSQCNRQASKVHIYQDCSVIDRLLVLQSGAKGFADRIANLFVVTNEITAWGGPKQRNQMYVDGALFAMTLMLALGAHGYASVPLNLAVSNSTERKIKREADIPSNERLIMMIAFGVNESGAWRAARSPRRPTQEIAAFH